MTVKGAGLATRPSVEGCSHEDCVCPVKIEWSFLISRNWLTFFNFSFVECKRYWFVSLSLFGVLWSRNVILSIKIWYRQRTMRWSPHPDFLLFSCLFCETEIATYNQWYCKQKILSSMIFSRFVLICLQLYFSYKLLKYDFFEFFVKTNTQLAQFWHHRFNI